MSLEKFEAITITIAICVAIISFSSCTAFVAKMNRDVRIEAAKCAD